MSTAYTRTGFHIFDRPTMRKTLLFVLQVLPAAAFVSLYVLKTPQYSRLENSALQESKEGEINPLSLSTPEAQEEYLNNLAASLKKEMPDRRVEDMMERLRLWAGDYDREKARGILQKQIDTHDALIFGLAECPYTIEAKELLKDVDFVARDLDTLPYQEQYALRAELAEMIQNRTQLPAIFLGGTFVGGCNDGPGLKSVIDSGKLEEMMTRKVQDVE